MKKRNYIFTFVLLAMALTAQAQKSPQDMNRFIDALMSRMTTEEKIGQLNLPAAGDITTGQAKSANIAQKIQAGQVGG
ncbi:MAG: hypothetical protein RR559_05285, partial [Bacteroides sp.]